MSYYTLGSCSCVLLTFSQPPPQSLPSARDLLHPLPLSLSPSLPLVPTPLVLPTAWCVLLLSLGQLIHQLSPGWVTVLRLLLTPPELCQQPLVVVAMATPGPVH